MKRVVETFTLPCTPETFWSIFLDGEYIKALFMGELGFRSLEVLELTSSSRKLLASPKVSLPGPIAKLVGDSFAYEEHGTLDRASNVWRWSMHKPKGGSKKDLVSTSGTIRVVADGPDKIKRTDEVSVEAHVFGLGGVIENVVDKELHNSWNKEIAFLKGWLAKRAPTT